ncbi:hypothetical protein CEB3_c21160 [Peptococcaceae bacterium CEB3]|nr:hypothetical protein CEB3_c21160 [Peptococcaceae bacterium CEB3]
MQRICFKWDENELDIAYEIYFAQSKNVLHTKKSYGPGLATRRTLLACLNTSVRRKGVICLYKEHFPEHFKDGKWQGRNAVVFVDYALKKLTDDSFVQNSKWITQFSLSIRNEKWLQDAIALMGLKMLENLFAHNELKSSVAVAVMEEMANYRQMMKEVEAIVRRVADRKEFDDFSQSLISKRLEVGGEKGLKCALEAYGNKEEQGIYERYRSAIEQVFCSIVRQNTQNTPASGG